MIFTRRWWRHTAVRACRTAAQTILATTVGDVASIWNIDWHTTLGLGLGSALVSVLMGLDRATVAPRLNPTPEIAELNRWIDAHFAANPPPTIPVDPPAADPQDLSAIDAGEFAYHHTEPHPDGPAMLPERGYDWRRFHPEEP